MRLFCWINTGNPMLHYHCHPWHFTIGVNQFWPNGLFSVSIDALLRANSEFQISLQLIIMKYIWRLVKYSSIIGTTHCAHTQLELASYEHNFSKVKDSPNIGNKYNYCMFNSYFIFHVVIIRIQVPHVIRKLIFFTHHT